MVVTGFRDVEISGFFYWLAVVLYWLAVELWLEGEHDVCEYYP